MADWSVIKILISYHLRNRIIGYQDNVMKSCNKIIFCFYKHHVQIFESGSYMLNLKESISRKFKAKYFSKIAMPVY